MRIGNEKFYCYSGLGLIAMVASDAVASFLHACLESRGSFVGGADRMSLLLLLLGCALGNLRCSQNLNAASSRRGFQRV
jgi:hypothetical protein